MDLTQKNSMITRQKNWQLHTHNKMEKMKNEKAQATTETTTETPTTEQKP